MNYIKAIWNRILQSMYRSKLSHSDNDMSVPPASEDAEVPPENLDAHTTHKSGWRPHGGARH